MGRPKRQPGTTQTRQRILEAAERAFAERGFDGAALESIAEQAGIRRPSLLYHFSTKQALYSAVIESVFAELGRQLAEAMAVDGRFAERLRAVADRFERYVDDRPSAAQLVLREILDDRGSGRDILLAAAQPLIDAVEAFVTSAPEADVETISVRDAIMCLACSRFVRASAGPLAEPLWGPPGRLGALALKLLVRAG